MILFGCRPGGDGPAHLQQTTSLCFSPLWWLFRSHLIILPPSLLQRETFVSFNEDQVEYDVFCILVFITAGEKRIFYMVYADEGPEVLACTSINLFDLLHTSEWVIYSWGCFKHYFQIVHNSTWNLHQCTTGIGHRARDNVQHSHNYLFIPNTLAVSCV